MKTLKRKDIELLPNSHPKRQRRQTENDEIREYLHLSSDASNKSTDGAYPIIDNTTDRNVIRIESNHTVNVLVNIFFSILK